MKVPGSRVTGSRFYDVQTGECGRRLHERNRSKGAALLVFRGVFGNHGANHRGSKAGKQPKHCNAQTRMSATLLKPRLPKRAYVLMKNPMKIADETSPMLPAFEYHEKDRHDDATNHNKKHLSGFFRVENWLD